MRINNRLSLTKPMTTRTAFLGMSCDVVGISHFIMKRMREKGIRQVSIFTQKGIGMHITDACYDISEEDEITWKMGSVLEFDAGYLIKIFNLQTLQKAVCYELTIVDQEMQQNQEVNKILADAISRGIVQEVVYWDRKSGELARFEHKSAPVTEYWIDSKISQDCKSYES